MNKGTWRGISWLGGRERDVDDNKKVGPAAAAEAIGTGSDRVCMTDVIYMIDGEAPTKIATPLLPFLKSTRHTLARSRASLL
jgi:hypothetical protein